MIEAVKEGMRIIEILLNFEVDINIANKISYDTALMLASQKGHIKIAEMLIKAGTDVNVVNKFGLV